MNELFFARRVLLVEGPEDLIAVTAVLQKAGRIRQRVEEIDWSVIPCGGKQSIPFFERVLNAFGIPYRVLHDADLDSGMTEDARNVNVKENEAIEALAAGRPVHKYPVRLERSLGRADHFRDQYDAHCFFLDPEKITPEVETIVMAATA